MMNTVFMFRGCDGGMVWQAARVVMPASSRADPRVAVTRLGNFMTSSLSGYRIFSEYQQDKKNYRRL
jgi:hypothetical protein